MSDDSAIFNEDSPTRIEIDQELALDDLYKHIPPPLPLFPKNTYTDSIPRSHILLQQIKRLGGIENEEPQGDKSPNNLPEKLPTVSLYSICEEKKIVYKREENRPYCANLLDLSKYIQCDYSEIKGFENITPYYKLKNNDSTLVFESRFESGNLSLAIKINDNEYNLLMQNDINTNGHTQWFYFRVSNTNKSTVKFNILNFSKKDSLYSQGMKILVYSEEENLRSNTGWFRDGYNISYHANNIRRPNSNKTFYTMTFTYSFDHINDTVYFAYSYPYTYSHLMEDLKKIEDLPFLTRKLLCYSIAGNRCDYLTITSPATPEEVKSRKGVIISARVHPGETVGSWMMKGVLDFLTGTSKEADELRKKYVFKIIPMLNPDGVINGNYRCGLAGVDLNRRWKNPSKNVHPTIHASKRLIKSLAKERDLELICDFHGHSRKKNIFTYGCNVSNTPETTRIFPYLLSKISPHFYYPYCSFRMQKSKQGTMRISLFKELKVPLIYTLEASFCGSDMVKYN